MHDSVDGPLNVSIYFTTPISIRNGRIPGESYQEWQDFWSLPPEMTGLLVSPTRNTRIPGQSYQEYQDSW